MKTHSTTPIGAWIKESREAARLSHDKLGEKVGTSRQHLIKLEKGLHRPRPDMIARIAEATGRPAPDSEDEEVAGLRLDDELLLRAMAVALQHAADSVVSTRERFAA